MQFGLNELAESLEWALTDNDILGFDPDDPEHCVAALRECLERELTLHIPEEDLRYIRAVLALLEQARWASRSEWAQLRETITASPVAPPVAPRAVLVEAPPSAPPRCIPSDPQAGHLNEGDPDDAPVHGTQTRYNNSYYKCRCEHCRRANSVYRRSRAAAVA